MKKLENVLIQYQGGGYDGCMWEWNYCLFDKDGKFHDIFSSGCMGCKTEDAIKKHLEVEPEAHWFIVPIIQKSLTEFADKSNAMHVREIAKWLSSHGINVPVIGHCTHCKKLIYVKDAILGNWYSDGGITYTAHDLICESCAIEMEEE